ncbi:arginine deiminase-like protein [Leptotrombidium deliense]|uniref:Arginine deiminase-like protein n=1 Tax=Leptotrombidium deliense TaxID=299467 RepID=A0A443SI06_9ACAR|nr:arginine deiminase-like protein [Leptotrombidium deliense]
MNSILCSLFIISILLQFHEIFSDKKQTGIRHENDVAKIIFTYTPGNEIMYSSLYPSANLYSRAMATKLAQKEHREMVEALKMLNATVVDLKELYLRNTEEANSEERIMIRNLSMETVVYEMDKLLQDFKKLKKWCKSMKEEQNIRCFKQLKELETQINENRHEKTVEEVMQTLEPENHWEVIINRPIVELRLRKKIVDKEAILGMESRFVDLYTRYDFGPYILTESKIEFGKFLKNRNFNLTLVSEEEQLKFAINFLNIGKATVITPYGEKSYLQKLRSIGVNPHFVNISHLSAGNGGIHCMTQVVYRY